MTDREVLLVLDPAAPSGPDDTPPSSLVVGGWELDADGRPGRFRANPDHVPSGPEVPSDPVDVVLRLLARDEAEASELLDALADTELAVALDADGIALVAPAPDGTPCVLVATAPAHRPRVVGAAGWYATDVTEVAAVLPEQGVDVLLNPGAPASMRVVAGAVRDAASRAV